MRIDWESWDSLFEFAMFPTHLDRESGRLLNAEDSAMGAGDPSARERELLDEWADESKRYHLIHHVDSLHEIDPRGTALLYLIADPDLRDAALAARRGLDRFRPPRASMLERGGLAVRKARRAELDALVAQDAACSLLWNERHSQGFEASFGAPSRPAGFWSTIRRSG